MIGGETGRYRKGKTVRRWWKGVRHNAGTESQAACRKVGQEGRQADRQEGKVWGRLTDRTAGRQAGREAGKQAGGDCHVGHLLHGNTTMHSCSPYLSLPFLYLTSPSSCLLLPLPLTLPTYTSHSLSHSWCIHIPFPILLVLPCIIFSTHPFSTWQSLRIIHVRLFYLYSFSFSLDCFPKLHCSFSYSNK